MRIINYLKSEIVLTASLVLAALSALVVHPDRQYFRYIDYRTLSILFCLMVVMKGLQEIGFFRVIAEGLLNRVRSIRELTLILVLLCFFFSMFITNDVALITFVPLTFASLDLLGENEKRRRAALIVIMETIAANLGSMLTPIGNPQNLYLYGQAGISPWQFIRLMLPYSAVSLAMLIIWILLVCIKGNAPLSLHFETDMRSVSKDKLEIYAFLFVVSILTVARAINYKAMLAVTVAAILITDRSVLKKVDYGLLLTFIGFFIFIGNVERIPVFHTFLQSMIEGREVLTAVISSQMISNVPAALLLSSFTKKYSLLIVGTNLGGLGTLIASMASLISYKYIARENNELCGKYIRQFTAANVIFLAVLLLCVKYVMLQY